MIPEKIRKIVPKKLRPPQEKAIEKGLFSGKNIVVSSPTASGKTLIAEMAGVNNLQKGKGKMLYIVPLKSLASEMYSKFSEKYPEFKIAISVGDYDSGDSWLEKYDIIITTSEKMDSLLRHRALWVENIGTIVFDEIHMIGNSTRGPTLELLIVKLREMCNPQIICLSATINNAKEISDWINAELVTSDYRPIPLEEGVFFGNTIFFDKKSIKVSGEKEQSVLDDTLRRDKQALFFVSSRRLAESLAKRLVAIKNDKNLDELSEKIKNALPVPTTQCVKLSETVKKGVAFHHAGLIAKQRNLLEEAFKKGLVKCICATPTLAMGVNLPAYRVIVRDLQRYSFGMKWISVLEYKQMAGRAGRPDYDEKGEAICFAKTESDKDDIFDKYINGEVEEILSKLSSEPALRVHLLALIANRYITSEESMKEFFSKTLWAKQFGDFEELSYKLNKILGLLIVNGFITDAFMATELGSRISELYIDPLTAVHFISCLQNNPGDELSYLQMFSNTLEMKPLLNVKANEYPSMQAIIDENEFLQEEPGPWGYEFDDFMASIKTSRMFGAWISEVSENEILENYRVTPGELHRRLYNIDWLAYSSQEIARIIGRKEHISIISNLRTRLKYGIKKEIIPLVRFKGIGRVRARKLFRNGIKNTEDIRKAPKEKLIGLLGIKITENLLEQI